jgi:hypothetical protein
VQCKVGKIAVFGGNLAEWPFSLSCNCITRIRGSSNGRFKRPGDSSSQCRRLVVLGHARTLFPTPAQVIIHLKHSPQHLIARWCVETAQGSELWAIKLKVNTRSLAKFTCIARSYPSYLDFLFFIFTKVSPTRT